MVRSYSPSSSLSCSSGQGQVRHDGNHQAFMPVPSTLHIFVRYIMPYLLFGTLVVLFTAIFGFVYYLKLPLPGQFIMVISIVSAIFGLVMLLGWLVLRKREPPSVTDREPDPTGAATELRDSPLGEGHGNPASLDIANLFDVLSRQAEIVQPLADTEQMPGRVHQEPAQHQEMLRPGAPIPERQRERLMRSTVRDAHPLGTPYPADWHRVENGRSGCPFNMPAAMPPQAQMDNGGRARGNRGTGAV